MVSTYVPLLLLFIIGIVLSLVIFSLSPLLGTKKPNPEKMTPYECGSESTGGRHVKLLHLLVAERAVLTNQLAVPALVLVGVAPEAARHL